MLENLIAYHCGPALSGIKPSNIVSCQKKLIPNIKNEIQKLNNQLNKNDIYLEIICECDRRALVMVYRKKVMEEHLNKRNNKKFLINFGYSEKGSISDYIKRLKKRLSYDSFPHEIGVFLGYPLYDIYCFINKTENDCLLTGEWKVYHNAEAAKKLFHRYSSCRNALVRKILKGNSLEQIFCRV